MKKWLVIGGVSIFFSLYLTIVYAGGIEISKQKALSKGGEPGVLKGVYGNRACFEVDNHLKYVKEGKEVYPGVRIEKILEGGSRVILSTPEGKKVLKKGENISGVSQKSEGIIYEKAPAIISKAKPTVKEYRIEKNDSLWKIAAREYGDGNKWKKIYSYNKDKIKNPMKLKQGLTILIPLE